MPYYRNLFNSIGATPDEIKNFEDFSRVPVLTKSDIQNSLETLTTTGIDRQRLSLNSTGGSTGMPLNFYQDVNYKHWSDAARIRAWRHVVGADENDLEAVLWGATKDIGQGLSFRKVLYSVLREGLLPLNTFDLDDSLLKKYLSYFNIIKPKILRGYASSLYYVALYVEKRALPIHRPKSIISSTEVLHARMRETIERVFGCPVFDSYGCREVSQIATECEAHNGLHVVFENQYVELDGQDIIVTNLHNYAMPFIRYKVGDLASSLDTSPCKCGRVSPRIVSLIGRDNDNIELPSGKVINGEFFEFLFFGLSSVIQYQVVYHKAIDRLRVKLHVSGSTENAGEIVQKTMREKFDYENVDVLYSDQFDMTPSGKLRFVYQVD
ncbi:phenylacetate--CoA ligase family protein [bacterium]|nr:MAG: phenylacetate--CoA ligase family protein [bacterium]